MTTPVKSQTIDISVDYNTIQSQLLYHNVFRQLRNARKKYTLSSNELLVLNAIRLYTLLINTEFMLGPIIKFVGYYNDKRMKYYLNSLLSKNLIYIHRTVGVRIYYRLSIEGINIVAEMFEDIDKRNRKFCEKYNVSL